jgi:hypothetical protein
VVQVKKEDMGQVKKIDGADEKELYVLKRRGIFVSL